MKQSARRSLILVVVLFMVLAVVCAQGLWSQPAPATTGTLTVEMTGFRNDKGFAMVALYASAEGFPDDYVKAFMKTRVPISGGQAEAVFENVPFGTYAVAMFHDEDSSGKMKRSFFGVPLEGYGFSQNPPKRARAPKYSEVQFPFDSPGLEIRVKLIY